jgi:hypothetical protein
MVLVGFEPAISAFDRAKTVHALDRAVTVIRFAECYCYFKLVNDAFIFSPNYAGSSSVQ